MGVCSGREGERIVLDGNWEENIPGAAYPLPWKPKNGMCTEIPSPAANLGGFIPNKRLEGFVPAVLLSQDLSFGCWCLTGDTGPQVAPPWSLERLQHVWILDIQSLGAFLHGALGSAPKPWIFWVPQKPEEPLGQSPWNRAGCAIPAMAMGMVLWELSDWICSRSWECLPRGAVLVCPVGFGTRSLQGVPADLNPSLLPVLIADGIFRPV